MNQETGVLIWTFFLVVGILSLTQGVMMRRQQFYLSRLERKLDALLQHQGVELPSRLSPEAQRLAQDPRQKISAIKLHREENPSLSLAEAKAEVEDFAGTCLNRPMIGRR